MFRLLRLIKPRYSDSTIFETLWPLVITLEYLFITLPDSNTSRSNVKIMQDLSICAFKDCDLPHRSKSWHVHNTALLNNIDLEYMLWFDNLRQIYCCLCIEKLLWLHCTCIWKYAITNLGLYIYNLGSDIHEATDPANWALTMQGLTQRLCRLLIYMYL